MIIFLVFLYIGSLVSAENSEELCTKCQCTGSRLDCSGKNLENHLPNATWNGTNFTEVSFDKNSIVRLSKFPATRIVKLILSHNGIATIEDAAFGRIADLEELDLSHNHLTTDMLKPDVFKGTYSTDAYYPLNKLKKLWLNGNSLHSLHQDLFEHLPAIEELILTGNPFRLIDHPTITAIASISFLKHLDMSNTQIGEIPPTMLHTPKLLEKLNISYNNFGDIPIALQAAHKLTSLIMDGNPIMSIRQAPQLKTLKEFQINNMPKLTKIYNLRNFSNLEIFSCSQNQKLRYIDEQTFSIRNADGQVWPPIREINLSYNSLNSVAQYLIFPVGAVKDWKLHMNPWTCDCTNQWMVDVLVPTINRTQPYEADRLMCAQPIEMLNKDLLKLSENHVEMRCLDKYGNQPEKDSANLIAVFVAVMICIPLLIFAITIYLQRMKSRTPFSRFVYRRTDSLETLP